MRRPIQAIVAKDIVVAVQYQKACFVFKTGDARLPGDVHQSANRYASGNSVAFLQNRPVVFFQHCAFRIGAIVGDGLLAAVQHVDVLVGYDNSLRLCISRILQQGHIQRIQGPGLKQFLKFRGDDLRQLLNLVGYAYKHDGFVQIALRLAQ